VKNVHPLLYSVIDPFEKRELINVNRDSVQAENIINKMRNTYNTLCSGGTLKSFIL
jgi:hypothetical protein